MYSKVVDFNIQLSIIGESQHFVAIFCKVEGAEVG